MKVIQRTDAQASGNPWVLSLIAHTSLHLDGKVLTLRIASNPQHDLYVAVIKTLYGGNIASMDPNKMSGVKVELTDDPQAPNDLVLKVDWSNYSGPGGGFGGLLGMLGLTRDSPNLGDISFHDWHTTKTELAYVQDALALRLYFENKPNAQLTYDVCGTGIRITDLVITAYLIPYVFWQAEVEKRIDKHGKPASGYWLSGQGIHKQRCALSLAMNYSNISPNQAGAAARDALGELHASLAESLTQATLFRYMEALFIKDNDLTPLISGANDGSLLRGVSITPGLARFLYFDQEDDMPSFTGHGKIVAVRKDRIRSSLLAPSEIGPGTKSMLHTYQPDNIIEVEIERDDGKHVRISTLNLVRSMLEGKAKIDDVHVAYRDRVWGEVYSDLNQPGGAWMTAELYYNGYLRSNPDAGAANNLDRLPTYEYNRNDPLYQNLYDGTFYFVQADLLPNGLKRFLYHRAWHLPLECDLAWAGSVTSCALLNGYMVFSMAGISNPYKIVLAK